MKVLRTFQESAPGGTEALTLDVSGFTVLAIFASDITSNLTIGLDILDPQVKDLTGYDTFPLIVPLGTVLDEGVALILDTPIKFPEQKGWRISAVYHDAVALDRLRLTVLVK